MKKQQQPFAIIELSRVREALRIPTALAVILAKKAGAELTRSSPGSIQVILPRSSMEVRVRIRLVNIYEREAEAYRLAGLPVPNEVQRDMENWYRKEEKQ